MIDLTDEQIEATHKLLTVEEFAGFVNRSVDEAIELLRGEKRILSDIINIPDGPITSEKLDGLKENDPKDIRVSTIDAAIIVLADWEGISWAEFLGKYKVKFPRMAQKYLNEYYYGQEENVDD